MNHTYISLLLAGLASCTPQTPKEEPLPPWPVWEILETPYLGAIRRTETPMGWLVVVSSGTAGGTYSVTYVPDPEKAWKRDP